MELPCAIELFTAATIGVVSDASIERYRAGLGRFASFIGDRDVGAVTAADIRQWRREMSDTLRPNTVNTYLAAVNRLYRWLIEEGHVSDTPTRAIRKVKTERTPRAINRDDAALLLNYLARQRHRRNLAIVLFLLGTGCRVSGLTGLTLDRLLLDEGRARVIEKGDRVRWVFLSPPVAEAVRDYIALDRPQSSDRAVFLNRYGQKMTRQSIWYMLRKAGDELGIERINPHSFRHAFAIERLRAGDNLSSVSALLGHASIETTQIYAIWETNALQQQHAKFDVAVSLTSDGNGKVP